MRHDTYDPIVESRTLPRLRLLSPLRPPEPGRALLLVPRSGETLTICHGEAVPDAWHGTYQYAILVDITEHRLVLDVPLLSKDPNFAYRARVGLTCRVNEPTEILARGIRDVGAALHDHTKRMLRQVSREYDIAQFHEAEQALNAAVRTFTGDAAIRLRNVTVELLVDDDEVMASGREFRDVERETRLDGKRRDRHLEMMRREGVEGLLAEIMDKEGPRAALEWIESNETAERNELMAALNTVLEHSDPHREPFDLLRAERTVIDRLMGGSAAPFGGTRPGRVKGTAPVELGTGGPAVPGRDDDWDEPAGGSLRGSVLSDSPSGPPEDEPPGGAAGDDDGYDEAAGGGAPGAGRSGRAGRHAGGTGEAGRGAGARGEGATGEGARDTVWDLAPADGAASAGGRSTDGAGDAGGGAAEDGRDAAAMAADGQPRNGDGGRRTSRIRGASARNDDRRRDGRRP